MKIICDHCLEELAIWYRVRDLFLCISCKEKDDAKNKKKEEIAWNVSEMSENHNFN